MRPYERVEQIDYDFVRDTFMADWPISVIAEKLERPKSTVEAIVAYLGLKRSSFDVKTPKHDWPSIWFAYQASASYAETARCMDMSRQVVAYAIQAMILMGTEQRLIRWNKYAVKHGRDLYTFKDANGSI